jgi:hypothetical protein
MFLSLNKQTHRKGMRKPRSRLNSKDPANSKKPDNPWEFRETTFDPPTAYTPQLSAFLTPVLKKP